MRRWSALPQNPLPPLSTGRPKVSRSRVSGSSAVSTYIAAFWPRPNVARRNLPTRDPGPALKDKKEFIKALRDH